jgi:hypothetical protein
MGERQEEIERLLDEAAIDRVLVQYCRGVDRGDAALIRDVYWPDATDEHGSFRGNGHEFAERVVTVLNAHAINTQHAITQTTIDFAPASVDGGSAAASHAASVETYVLARHKVLHDGALRLETFGGRYVDRFEKRAGVWKIQRRQVIHDWSNIMPITAEYPNDAFAQGKRDRTDASYVR